MKGLKEVWLVASGDLRLAANQLCWAAQEEMEQQLGRAVKQFGLENIPRSYF